MKKYNFLILLFLIPLLNACDDNKTVEYWDNHKEERTEYLKKCANGDVDRESQTCENARRSKTHDHIIYK